MDGDIPDALLRFKLRSMKEKGYKGIVVPVVGGGDCCEFISYPAFIQTHSKYVCDNSNTKTPSQSNQYLVSDRFGVKQGPNSFYN